MSMNRPIEKEEVIPGLPEDMQPKIHTEEFQEASDFKPPGLLPEYPNNPGMRNVWVTKNDAAAQNFYVGTLKAKPRKDVPITDVGDTVLHEITEDMARAVENNEVKEIEKHIRLLTDTSEYDRSITEAAGSERAFARPTSSSDLKMVSTKRTEADPMQRIKSGGRTYKDMKPGTR